MLGVVIAICPSHARVGGQQSNATANVPSARQMKEDEMKYLVMTAQNLNGLSLSNMDDIDALGRGSQVDTNATIQG